MAWWRPQVELPPANLRQRRRWLASGTAPACLGQKAESGSGCPHNSAANAKRLIVLNEGYLAGHFSDALGSEDLRKVDALILDLGGDNLQQAADIEGSELRFLSRPP